MSSSNIPTNVSKNGKTIYATKELVETLASYKDCVKVRDLLKPKTVEGAKWYWYDHSAFNKNEPLGLISEQDAYEEDKPGCAFAYFDSTVPAIPKSAAAEIFKSFGIIDNHNS